MRLFFFLPSVYTSPSVLVQLKQLALNSLPFAIDANSIATVRTGEIGENSTATAIDITATIVAKQQQKQTKPGKKSKKNSEKKLKELRKNEKNQKQSGKKTKSSETRKEERTHKIKQKKR